MKFLAILFIAILCANASAQTIRSIGYNTTNGQVVAATNVVWTNNFSFSTNTVAAEVRTNLGLGANWLTNTNVTNFRTSIGLGWSALTNTNATNFRSAIGLGTNDIVTLAYGTEAYIGQDGGSLYVENFYPDYIQCGQFGIAFGTTNSAAITRTNLGLALPALTNTSNVTMMRALAGSTNTNQPFSGIIQYADSPMGDTYEMTVSNGIILKTELQ